jgi:excinuclease UvrABC ATPase subunit
MLGVVVGVSLFLGGYVYAQEKSDALAQSDTKTQLAVSEQQAVRKPLTVDEIVQKMTTDLNLTQEQTVTLKPIIEQNRAKRRELLETLKQQGADKEAIRTQMEQLNQEWDQQLSKTLNPDQMAKLKTLRAERHLRGGKK